MEHKLIAPGLWEIDTFRVQRDETTREWYVHDGEGKVCAGPLRSLEACREWIREWYDSIDLGLTGVDR